VSKASRIVGIDYGMARIGVSLSDERKILASPIATVQAEKKLELSVKKVLAEIEKQQAEKNFLVEEIVVGLPLMLNGSIGMLADEVKLFVEQLREVTDIPIVTWDERLTSVQAERSLMESGMSRKKRSKVIDKVAAVIILQSYLDSKGI